MPLLPRLHRVFWFLILSLASLQASPEGKPIRIACVGDSITEGRRAGKDGSLSYPIQLGRLLGAGYVVENFGCSGATLLTQGDKPYREQAVFAAAQRFAPDVVVIALGTNDTKPGNWVHHADFTGDYRALIGAFRDLPSRPRIFVCLPMPAWPPSGWGISPELIAGDVREMIKQVAREENVPLIDWYEAMQDHADLVPDHVHPEAEGSGILARAVAATLIPAASPSAPR